MESGERWVRARGWPFTRADAISARWNICQTGKSGSRTDITSFIQSKWSWNHTLIFRDVCCYFEWFKKMVCLHHSSRPPQVIIINKCFMIWEHFFPGLEFLEWHLTAFVVGMAPSLEVLGHFGASSGIGRGRTSCSLCWCLHTDCSCLLPLFIAGFEPCVAMGG